MVVDDLPAGRRHPVPWLLTFDDGGSSALRDRGATRAAQLAWTLLRHRRLHRDSRLPHARRDSQPERVRTRDRVALVLAPGADVALHLGGAAVRMGTQHRSAVGDPRRAGDRRLGPGRALRKDRRPRGGGGRNQDALHLGAGLANARGRQLQRRRPVHHPARRATRRRQPRSPAPGRSPARASSPSGTSRKRRRPSEANATSGYGNGSSQTPCERLSRPRGSAGSEGRPSHAPDCSDAGGSRVHPGRRTSGSRRHSCPPRSRSPGGRHSKTRRSRSR